MYGCKLPELPDARLSRYLSLGLSDVDANILVQKKEIGDYFDDFFLSYKMGMSKPSPEIFSKVAEGLGINPCEALFIDDSQANVDAAAKLGFQTMCVEPYTDFSDKLL